MDKVFHMAGGEGATSYSKNSSVQRIILKKVKPILEKCIEELLRDIGDLHHCIKVADLGCSSGPNLFLTAQHIIESIDKTSRKITNPHQDEPLSIQYFLNDLVSNDFGLVLKCLPPFYQKMEQENGRPFGSYLIAIMPGTFYGKLFPERSMHFFYSSYSLHWLSQVPNGLVTETGIPRNKGSIYCGKRSPPGVHQAYLDQFTQDFTMFLRMRSQEIAQHGQLLLTFICKNEEEVECSHYLFLMVTALSDMVIEGEIKEDKLDSFNLPFYPPSVHEAKQIIQSEGSFKILSIQTFKTCLDAGFKQDNNEDDEDLYLIDRAKYVATYLRAVFGPILANHFGEANMDSLFRRFADKLVKVIQMKQGPHNSLVISLGRQ